MFKDKARRLFRRFGNNLKSILTVWIPAGLVAGFFLFVVLSVALSNDASFYDCGRMLARCAGDDPSVGRMAKCAYQTAWCDANVIWDRLNGKKFPDLPGLPVADERADAELFEKLTSEEFLQERFAEQERFERENPHETGLPADSAAMKAYIDEVRADRQAFEAEQALKRAAALRPVKDDLTGKAEK